METWLVTGGAGFIGGCFVRRLAGNKDIRVIIVDKLTYAGNLDSIHGALRSANVRFVQTDICESETIAGVLREENVSSIIHFAAESHVDRSIDSPEPSSLPTF